MLCGLIFHGRLIVQPELVWSVMVGSFYCSHRIIALV